ncbi:hypothetical protein BOX15_Mlig018404g1, partial [Macrostomum lignano]
PPLFSIITNFYSRVSRLNHNSIRPRFIYIFVIRQTSIAADESGQLKQFLKHSAQSSSMSTGRGRLASGYSRARRRFCSRRESLEDFSVQSYNATTPSKTTATQPAVAAAGQFGNLGGPYLQQVMPGLHLGLSWRQMFFSLFFVSIAHGVLAYFAFISWLGTTEVLVSYTSCAKLSYPNQTAQECEVTFNLPAQIDGQAYVYFRLCNFHLNHRHVYSSWSMPQLLGKKPNNIKYSCKKFTYRDEKLVLPCGALPNAIFNDTVNVTGPLNSDIKNATTIPLSSSNLSWPSHTAGLHKALPAKLLENTVKPMNWPEPAAIRYKRPFENADDLWVWLVTPAFPCFRKLIHWVDSNESLSAGKYKMSIGYHYPVAGFGGTKSFVVAGKSLLGGKNLALAVLPSAVSAVYFLLSLSTLIECYCRLRKRAIALGIVVD